jgi:xylose isomerase
VLTDDDWEKWVIIIKQYMAQPGVQLFWSRTAVAFNPTFRGYVEELGSKEVYSYAYGQPAA